MTRLAADAAHQFGGIELDRSKPVRFRLDGRRIEGFAGDTVLSAALAGGIDTVGLLDGHPVGMTLRFAPPISAGGSVMPMDVAPAFDGADYTTVGLRRRTLISALSPRRTLGHDLSRFSVPAWRRGAPEETLAGDLLVVGAGVAGLSAALAAAGAGRRVIVCERRPWLGGDARYYGAVGDEETPEKAVGRLAAAVASSPNITVLERTLALSLGGGIALAYQTLVEGAPRGRLISIAAERTLLATGNTERLPIFPGNRLPGVLPAIEAYHLAKRYGVTNGTSAVVATQSNIGFRLALRLSEAGVAVRRIVDARPAAQSRFIDFAKASGLILAAAQIPASAVAAPRGGLHVSWNDVGTDLVRGASEVSQLVVAGSLQPELSLWMRAGGRVQWNGARLVAAGHVDRVMLAGAVAGYRSLVACQASGRATAASLFGDAAESFDDPEIGAPFETPEVPVGISPVTTGAPAFLDSGTSLARRQDAAAQRHRELSAGDVAAQVELRTIAPGDAGAVAEEHGAPGGDVLATTWSPSAQVAEPLPAWLASRLGDDPLSLHLVVDERRRFERGALVYRNSGPREPHAAIGVITAEGSPGGIALVSRQYGDVDRFIVVGLTLTSPARPAPSAQARR